MKSCVKVFAAKGTGSGDQVITGIVDSIDGLPFTPKGFMFYGSTAVNILGYSTGANSSASRWQQGWDNADDYHLAGSVDEVQDSGAKITCTCNAGTVSLLDLQADIFIAGTNCRSAYVSAVASGQFTITYNFNTRTGDSYVVIILGGDDLEIGFGSLNPTTITPGFESKALLMFREGTSPPTGPVQSTGSDPIGFGWACISGDLGSSSMRVLKQAGNNRYQRDDKCWVQTNDVGNERVITSWDETSVVVSGSNDAALRFMILGGDTLRAAAGAFTQDSGIVHQTVTTGIKNSVVILLSVGAPANNSLDSTVGELAQGAMTPDDQGVYWTAEVVNNTVPLLGARYLSNTDVLLFGTPNGSGTTFSAKAQFVSFDAVAGTFTISWSVNDDVPRQILWLALGEEVDPPPPPSPQSGIYFLDPTATHDTLYTAYDPVTTIEVKIP